MALNAAHFTATFQQKPSVFEVIAQDSLNETLYPALQKVSSFLTTNCPNKCSWLGKHYDEVFLGLNGLLQYHYLNNYSASFAENFYGLQRVPLKGTAILSENQKQLSFLILVVLPYFRRKLEEKIVIYRLQNAEGALRHNFKDNFKKALVFLYSALQLGWGTFVVINYIKYMSNQKEAQLPMLNLIGLRLIYSENAQNIEGFWSSLFRGHLTISELSGGLLKNTVGSVLEIAAFFMQFLQAWNTENSNYDLTALPIPPAPSHEKNAQKYSGKCPICMQSWKIPTVVPVSGYVYCFPCILHHLRENRTCPVTNLPSKPLDIIRLYD